jgi:DNA-binding NarL/FixJ family response regulator
MPESRDWGAGALRVAVAVADPLLAERLAGELAGAPSLVISIGEALDADVALLDVEPAGLEAPAIVLADGRDAADLLRSGARAVLPTAASGPELRAAIEAVTAGLTVLAADALADFLGRDAWDDADEETADEGRPAAVALTRREAEVLALLAEGASNKVIARRLGISFSTAKFHVASLLAKLGARSRSDAVALGVRYGLLML